MFRRINTAIERIAEILYPLCRLPTEIDRLSQAELEAVGYQGTNATISSAGNGQSVDNVEEAERCGERLAGDEGGGGKRKRGESKEQDGEGEGEHCF